MDTCRCLDGPLVTIELMAVRAPGVGPSIVKSLVEMMGGAVDVQSAPGIGSIFSTTVPLWREQNAEAVEPTAV